MEEVNSFNEIARSYLTAKFLDCTGQENCKYLRDKKEVEILLREVLPPVTPIEFDSEVKFVMSKIGAKTADISVEEYVDAVINNNFWENAGRLTVKELIFLDCLFSYYYKGKELLSNDDYNELKNQLTWEG